MIRSRSLTVVRVTCRATSQLTADGGDACSVSFSLLQHLSTSFPWDFASYKNLRCVISAITRSDRRILSPGIPPLAITARTMFLLILKAEGPVPNYLQGLPSVHSDSLTSISVVHAFVHGLLRPREQCRDLRLRERGRDEDS